MGNHYKAEDLINFGKAVLIQIGYPIDQAEIAAMVLVESDLRGDHPHGIAGGSSLDDIYAKVSDNAEELGFKRVEIADPIIEQSKYPSIIIADAQGTLGHYVAWRLIPMLIGKAKKYGYAKAYLRNSTHFGDCAIYSEEIAKSNLAAKVTCTAPQWTKAFVKLQDPDPNSPANIARYDGVSKRFGTNPIAWSIPYENGIITIDMAATQRAVSPALEVAKFNAQRLGVYKADDGKIYVPVGDQKILLKDIHKDVASSESYADACRKLGLSQTVELQAVEKGLVKGPEGQDINFPLCFDEVFKQDFWIAPLGDTYFGYKGYGLNMIIEMDNVVGGGTPNLIRKLDENGKPTTPERVSQTLEAYAIDALDSLHNVQKRLHQCVETTLQCANSKVLLPGQKEQKLRSHRLQHGIPMSEDRINMLKQIGEQTDVECNLTPVN